ncbi:alpha/beta fold hydrolase [Henriciella aquimarina]|uniref:alpha/beta fold hydrolase n=1 Tax=Henriciella aquimarina TaxID=545261 RepID=UPI000A0261EB|nr:alpha/beta hydrolase [Henriciella aquimarina]
MKYLLSALAGLVMTAPAAADPMLSDFDYPWPVERHALVSQGHALEMAYLDVTPEQANGETVVLLHGKNFCAATWEVTMQALLDAGYRVVAPDQIGFCKSSKPQGYQYGLHTLAANTHGLLEALGVDDPVIMGHSMGGMLAARYALQYPDTTGALVLLNPIGLEDWRAKGVPNVTVDELYEGQLKTTRDGIKAYQQSTYYVGEWKDRYDRWVDMLWSMYQGEGGRITAWHQALTADMVFNQPVVHEFPDIAVPTLLLIGEKDNTALGKGRASEAVQAELGNYETLARETEQAIPDARLVTFPDLGHSPHIEAPERFQDELLAGLETVLAE